MHMQSIYTPPSNHLLISSGLHVVKVQMANVYSTIANTCLNGGRNAIHSLNIRFCRRPQIPFVQCNTTDYMVYLRPLWHRWYASSIYVLGTGCLLLIILLLCVSEAP